MTQTLEGIAIGRLAASMSKDKCPFKLEVEAVEEEEEGCEDDDDDAVEAVQKNSGGVLGENLVDGSNGAKSTVGGPFPPPDASKAARPDSSDGRTVLVLGAAGIPTDDYDFTAAAHHLIPGNASLAESELAPYLKRNGKVKSESGKSWKIKEHIGYNVNGAHNGVWLPSTYAIRSHNSPMKKVSWGGLVDAGKIDWCINYIGAASKAIKGTLHDTHEEYSEAVLKCLNKMQTVLLAHQDGCDDCNSLTDVAPPYLVKQRLYAMSRFLKRELTTDIGNWNRIWFTSDKWRKEIFVGGRVSAFVKARQKAQVIK